jgi:hypothetical protein
VPASPEPGLTERDEGLPGRRIPPGPGAARRSDPSYACPAEPGDLGFLGGKCRETGGGSPAICEDFRGAMISGWKCRENGSRSMGSVKNFEGR